MKSNIIIILSLISLLIIANSCVGCSNSGRKRRITSRSMRRRPKESHIHREKRKEPEPKRDEDMGKLNTAKDCDYLTESEKGVILEMNKVRQDPKRYAEIYIEPYLDMFEEGNVLNHPEIGRIGTEEGVEAVKDCINYLKHSSSRKLLYPSLSLTKAAEEHAVDQGRTGAMGHIGSNGSTPAQRLKRNGANVSGFAENIYYGNPTDPRFIVIDLLIDDGVPGRGHRKNIMSGNLGYAGVSIRPHKSYGHVCVIDYSVHN